MCGHLITLLGAETHLVQARPAVSCVCPASPKGSLFLPQCHLLHGSRHLGNWVAGGSCGLKPRTGSLGAQGPPELVNRATAKSGPTPATLTPWASPSSRLGFGGGWRWFLPNRPFRLCSHLEVHDLGGKEVQGKVALGAPCTTQKGSSPLTPWGSQTLVTPNPWLETPAWQIPCISSHSAHGTHALLAGGQKQLGAGGSPRLGPGGLRVAQHLPSPPGWAPRHRQVSCSYFQRGEGCLHTPLPDLSARGGPPATQWAFFPPCTYLRPSSP